VQLHILLPGNQAVVDLDLVEGRMVVEVVEVEHRSWPYRGWRVESVLQPELVDRDNQVAFVVDLVEGIRLQLLLLLRHRHLRRPDPSEQLGIAVFQVVTRVLGQLLVLVPTIDRDGQ
jgi:hypothetical protein